MLPRSPVAPWREQAATARHQYPATATEARRADRQEATTAITAIFQISTSDGGTSCPLTSPPAVCGAAGMLPPSSNRGGRIKAGVQRVKGDPKGCSALQLERGIACTSLSRLVIVLTLPMNEEAGHLPYLSQSAYPAKGTTVGGRTDDPRRERTRNAVARHRARAGTGQRQRGVSRVGDLADGLLSLAHAPGTLGGRRRAPRRRRAQAGRPVATAPEVERLVLGIAISAATWG
jgi:hypothetical protein